MDQGKRRSLVLCPNNSVFFMQDFFRILNILIIMWIITFPKFIWLLNPITEPCCINFCFSLTSLFYRCENSDRSHSQCLDIWETLPPAKPQGSACWCAKFAVWLWVQFTHLWASGFSISPCSPEHTIPSGGRCRETPEAGAESKKGLEGPSQRPSCFSLWSRSPVGQGQDSQIPRFSPICRISCLLLPPCPTHK